MCTHLLYQLFRTLYVTNVHEQSAPDLITFTPGPSFKWQITAGAMVAVLKGLGEAGETGTAALKFPVPTVVCSQPLVGVPNIPVSARQWMMRQPNFPVAYSDDRRTHW